MKKIFICLILAFFAFVEAPFASGPYYVNFSFTVQPTTEFWVSGNPPPLIIDSMLPGDPSAEVSDENTTWSFSSNEWTGYKKVIGKIDQSMPDHTYLKVNLESYEAKSSGDVSLTTDPQSLVTDIEFPEEEAIITYKFGASPAAGTLSGTRTVTFTVADM
ncbi:MAG: hypothetical protein AB1502_13305 [Thermodesulfobacteriota bacterium]